MRGERAPHRKSDNKAIGQAGGFNSWCFLTVCSANKHIDWELLQDELIKASGNVADNTKEHEATKTALAYALNHDEKGFKTVSESGDGIFQISSCEKSMNKSS